MLNNSAYSRLGNKDKMLILLHRKMNVLYVWLVSPKYIYRLQSYGKSPITSGSPLVLMVMNNFTAMSLAFVFLCPDIRFTSVSTGAQQLTAIIDAPLNVTV